MKNEIMKRLKNPVFILATSGMIYMALRAFKINIAEGTYKDIIDLIAYITIGTGVYKTYDVK